MIITSIPVPFFLVSRVGKVSIAPRLSPSSGYRLLERSFLDHETTLSIPTPIHHFKKKKKNSRGIQPLGAAALLSVLSHLFRVRAAPSIFHPANPVGPCVFQPKSKPATTNDHGSPTFFLFFSIILLFCRATTTPSSTFFFGERGLGHRQCWRRRSSRTDPMQHQRMYNAVLSPTSFFGLLDLKLGSSHPIFPFLIVICQVC